MPLILKINLRILQAEIKLSNFPCHIENPGQFAKESFSKFWDYSFSTQLVFPTIFVEIDLQKEPERFICNGHGVKRERERERERDRERE